MGAIECRSGERFFPVRRVLYGRGANPRQRLPTYWSQMRKWRGYQQHKLAISDEILSEATAKMAAVLAEHYHMSERFMLQVLKTNWHDFVEIRWDTRQQPALCQTREFGVQNGPYGAYLTLKARTQIRLPTGPIPRIPLDASLWGSLQIFSDVELNVMASSHSHSRQGFKDCATAARRQPVKD